MIPGKLGLVLLIFWSCASASEQRGDEILLRELMPGVWLHTSFYSYPSGAQYPSNGLLVRDGESLTLIDTAWGELATQRLLEKIDADTGLPVARALVTHAHGGLAGTDVLKAHGIPVYAHPRTVGLAAEMGLPVPDRKLSGLGQEGSMAALGKLQVYYPGPAHATDNLMVWMPEQQLLYGGCAVREMAARSIGNTAPGDIRSWREVMEETGTRYGAARLVVPGHGKPGGVGLLSHTAALINVALEEQDNRHPRQN